MRVRDWVADALLALLLAFLAVSPVEPDQPASPSLVGVGMALAGTLPLALRRRHPVAVMSAIGATALLRGAAGLPHHFAVTFAVMVALFSVAYYSTAAMALFIGIITLFLLPFDFVIEWAQRGSMDLSIVPYNFALLGSAWLTGDNLRQRRERVQELEEKAARIQAEHAERERRAVAEERAHIARELHDLISHSLGVIVVQAGAGRRLAASNAERAAAVLGLVEETGRSAMADMRRLLNVLRTGADREAPQAAPQPTLKDLDQLVEQVRGAGLDVELQIELAQRGRRRTLPAGVELSAYRIVQEALTNCLRHSGARRAEVLIRRSRDEIEVTVSDDGHGANGAVAGHGLIGMRERAELFGGSIETGSSPEGGFQVRARLSLAGAA